MVQKLNGMSARLKAERSEMPVMMPGRAIGRMTSSEIASRPKNFVRLTAAAQSVPSTSAITVEMLATLSDRPERLPDVGAVPGHGEPFQGQARRRPLVGFVLGREGVDEDQQDRQVHEGEAEAGGDLQAQRRAVRVHRKLPAVWRSRDRPPSDRIGTTAKAAASGMFPAVP